MKIISWNINSVRLRLPLLLELMQEFPAEVICLQETKTPDAHFPAEAIKQAGYPHLAFHGEKGYNGVAILSRIAMQPHEIRAFGGNEQARHVSATLETGLDIHNLYIPAGGDEPDPQINPKFAHKLLFVDELTEWSSSLPATRQQVILGDFNIAPLEQDVWSSKQLRKVVSHTDMEREKLSALQQAGNWTDSHRHFVPAEQKLYSWWSYRARDWGKSNRGRRLDHIWTAPDTARQLKAAGILKPYRGKPKPSDHAPIWIELS